MLPTNGTARFSSALGVDSFIKKSSYLYYNKEELEKIGRKSCDVRGRGGLDGSREFDKETSGGQMIKQ